MASFFGWEALARSGGSRCQKGDPRQACDLKEVKARKACTDFLRRLLDVFTQLGRLTQHLTGVPPLRHCTCKFVNSRTELEVARPGSSRACD